MCADKNISVDNEKVQHLLRSMTERNKDSLLLKEDLTDVKTFDEIYAQLSKEEIFWNMSIFFEHFLIFLIQRKQILSKENSKLTTF